MKYTIQKKAACAFILFVILLGAEIFSTSIVQLKYADELVAGICYLYIAFKLICKKHISLVEKYILLSLLFISIVGLLSNFVARIRTDIALIALDWVGFTKIFAIFFFIIWYLDLKSAMQFTHLLKTASKVFLIFATAFGTVNLFVDLHMSISTRYGMRAFRFFLSSEHSFSGLVMMALMLITCTEKKETTILVSVSKVDTKLS